MTTKTKRVEKISLKSTLKAKMGDETYISQLKAERDNIDQSFTHAIRLLGEGKLAMTVFLEQNFQKT